MSCPQNRVDSSMTYPENETRKTAQEVLEEVVDLLRCYLHEQSDTPDALLPLIYEINARAMRVLMQYQPLGDHDTRVGRRKKDTNPVLDRIIKVTAERAARIIEDALERYEAGWRLEIIKRDGSEYARWRRSTGSGWRETKYIGVVSSKKIK